MGCARYERDGCIHTLSTLDSMSSSTIPFAVLPVTPPPHTRRPGVMRWAERGEVDAPPSGCAAIGRGDQLWPARALPVECSRVMAADGSDVRGEETSALFRRMDTSGTRGGLKQMAHAHVGHMGDHSIIASTSEEVVSQIGSIYSPRLLIATFTGHRSLQACPYNRFVSTLRSLTVHPPLASHTSALHCDDSQSAKEAEWFDTK